MYVQMHEHTVLVCITLMLTLTLVLFLQSQNSHQIGLTITDTQTLASNVRTYVCMYVCSESRDVEREFLGSLILWTLK
jgi:hypothetical protein